MWPTWGPPGSCRPQMGRMLAPSTKLSEWSHFQQDLLIETLWRPYRSVIYIIVDSIYGLTQFPQPMGLLPDTQNCRLRMPRECRERFPCHRPHRKPLVNNPGMREARAVMHAEIANPWWRGKRSRHSWCMRNPQFYVSGKRPMLVHLL